MSYAIAGKIAGLGAYGQGQGSRPGSPYLYSGIGQGPYRYSGIRGLGLGLGDASYDAAVAAYNADHAAWVQEQTTYNRAMQSYALVSAGQNASYASSYAGYSAALATWQAQQAAYAQAVNQANLQNNGRSASYSAATSAAQQAGVVIPAGYPGCVTQAQHDTWAQACASASIKGLGAAPTGPACGLAQLAVCQSIPAAPTPPGPQPQPPVKPALPSPPAALRPEPQPPAPPAVVPGATISTTPAYVPPSTPTPYNAPTVTDSLDPLDPSSPTLGPTPGAAATKTGGLLSNGLLLVVLAGGSYALYRSLRKPRPRAA